MLHAGIHLELPASQPSALRPGMILYAQSAGRSASNAVEKWHQASNAVETWRAELRIRTLGSSGLPDRYVHLA